MDRCAHMHGTYLRTLAYKCGSCIQMDAQDTLSQMAFASDKADFEHSHTSGLQPVLRSKWSHIRHIVTFQHDYVKKRTNRAFLPPPPLKALITSAGPFYFHNEFFAERRGAPAKTWHRNPPVVSRGTPYSSLPPSPSHIRDLQHVVAQNNHKIKAMQLQIDILEHRLNEHQA